MALIFIYSTKWPYIKTMNAKNTKKSPIHENGDANITCDFGDGDISRSRSRLPHTHTDSHIASSIIVRLCCISFSHLLTFLDHLLVQGRPVFYSSSIFDLGPCLQSVGISLCLPICCPSISFSVGLCSFSQKPLVLAISHRCGCVLASSSGQTTLVFCPPPS